MPYINKARRGDFEEVFWDLKGMGISNPGELNYLLTKLALIYCTQSSLSYQDINDVLGAMEGAKMEFYRRVAVPYEDKKKKENGDVYNAE